MSVSIKVKGNNNQDCPAYSVSPTMSITAGRIGKSRGQRFALQVLWMMSLISTPCRLLTQKESSAHSFSICNLRDDDALSNSLSLVL